MSILRRKISRRSFVKGAGAALALGAGGKLLSSCAPADPEVSASPTITLKQRAVELTFWVIPYWEGRTGTEEGGQKEDYYNWQIETFNEEYPNVSVKAEFVPSSFDGFARFDTAVAAGHPPDVMWGQAGNDWKYAPLGAVEPFDDWIDPDVMADMIEPVIDICTYVDGGIYIWPYGMALAGGVFANRDLFEKVGAADLLPDGPDRAWTVSEFEEALQAVTGKIDGQDVYGMALMTDWYYQPMQFFYGFGAAPWNVEQTKMTIDSPEGVECLQWLVDLEHQNGWMLPGTAGRMNEDVLRFFSEQRIAVYPSQPYYITAFRLQPEMKPDFDWYFCQPPHVEGKEIGVEANVHGFLVSKQDDKDKLAIAMKFVEHLTRPEALEIATWGQGVVPPRKSLLHVLEGDPDRHVESILAEHARPFTRLYAEIAPKAITPNLDAAFAGTKSPEQALKDMAAAGDTIFMDTAEQYGWPIE